MSGLDTLRERYRWPNKHPGLEMHDSENWFDCFVKSVMTERITDDMRVLVEVGSWLGASACYMRKLANREATIICIDPFDTDPEYEYPEQPKYDGPLYQQFIANCWPWRKRIIPMVARSPAAIVELHDLHVPVDFVFIDGNHEYEAVHNDIETVLSLYPNAVLIGHDYDNVRPGVRKAVDDIAKREGCEVRVVGTTWEFVR